MSTSADCIRIRGAREHNLRDCQVDFPRQRLSVITGPSGSGKSTLAFDILVAEGQRQFLETLAVSSRRKLEYWPAADVDLVDGLPPTLSLDQHPGPAQPRATVGTLTEIDHFLRVLLARLGEVTCRRCRTPLVISTPQQIEEWLAALPEGSRVVLLAPLRRAVGDEPQALVSRVRAAGLLRVRVDGVLWELEQLPPQTAQEAPYLEAVVDRLVIRSGMQGRLAESVRLALRHGEGVVCCSWQAPSPAGAPWQDEPFSTVAACARCGERAAEMDPRLFNFNSPYGACPTCRGLGVTTDEPPRPCPACQGKRLRPEALEVMLGGRNLAQLASQEVADLIDFFANLPVPERLRPLADPLLREIGSRLRYLTSVDVGYLNLARAADTLSNGERQRVRLAACLGTGLTGVCYVLDEPSVGLHPRDTDRLLETLCRLRDQGSTVIAVEHDAGLIRRADWVVDVGPGAGRQGGQIVACGTPEAILQDPHSPTGRCLAEGNRPVTQPTRRPARPERLLRLLGVATHNLRGVSVDFPLGCLIAVTGVSGSGKSSLIQDTLAPALFRVQGRTAPEPGPFQELVGAELIDRLIVVDQSPLGLQARGCPATYTGALDEIRQVLAQTKEARQRGFRAARFSYNHPAGRCDACLGHGWRRLEMQFLPDLEVVCAQCGGRRYNEATLAVRFRGRSIADILEMSIEEARDFFANVEKIRRILDALVQIGVGYLPLGQRGDTLSGGEAQRVKLATELCQPETGNTLYLLDEPTRGLHFQDVTRLLHVLDQLVGRGNTVITVEHHLDVIAAADWVIDLGPEGGLAGGQLLASGPPEVIAATPGSHTGRYLRERLSQLP